MCIRDLLNKKDKKVYTVQSQKTIKDAIRLMNEKRIGALIVVNDSNELTGIITERDILTNIEALSLSDQVSTIMTSSKKLIIVYEDDSLEYAMNIFTNNKIRHLPVFHNKSFTGIISIGDAVKGILSEQQSENKLLHDYITGTYPVCS